MINQLTLSIPRIQYSSLRKVDSKQNSKSEKKRPKNDNVPEKTSLSQNTLGGQNGCKLNLVL